MKAIETVYKEYKMRSRLEARWATFLDHLHIEWNYEEEGYILSNGIWYLPDFHLPTFDHSGTFVEVKPKKLTNEEREKCRLLCLESQQSVWLAVGVPSFMCYEVFYYNQGQVVEGDGIPNADQAENENRFFGMSAYGECGGNINIEYRNLLGDTFINAVKEARAARFEHNK